jgi:hypothetical protein
MKRTLIAAVISGAIALSTALPLTVVGAEPVAAIAPAPEATPDSTQCPSADGSRLAIGGGCCQRRGGLCRCRAGNPVCCDGSTGVGCSCRGDSLTPEAVSSEVSS